ncbi:RNA-directed DNA polymerase, eukaryota, reverse transcriptase zinc-binding domain protein [Tanacetum coccineum]|uniref:RNA-directed DNA polymerase, eukaryota, reverse transcriptase zinc-binding domain protein n=1 Tax=Tanacetum coccineum TaxID=301880 RepID=A0ABQ5EF24_9ASTR
MAKSSFEGQDVANQFVVHFKNFLGQSYEVKKINECNSLFKNMISDDEALSLVEDVSYKEIKDALFDIVKEFFNSGKLLKDLNSTVISLILKTQNPLKVTDYRPIACCNVVYKCISKVTFGRIKKELLKGYDRKGGPNRVACKIDIQKAYDTVNWSFLETILTHFGFPKRMINWIMICVKTTSFTINVNGENYGFFQGGRGLRQGDPIIKITHVCFADDLLILCHGDTDSIKAVKDSIDEFEEVQEEIMKSLHFEKGKLPMKYLGVPLITKRLGIKNCKCLVDKVRKRISNWKNKCLSYAGRLQFIASIPESIQVYWCTMFLLPKTVIKDINNLLIGFLWCNGEISRGKAKISWKKICKPKSHGGLGLKDLEI